MAIPWKVLDRFFTDDEGVLELRQRGEDDFLITVGPQVLMNSRAQRSEAALGELGCRPLRGRSAPRVLVGGLGMAITLRSVLDALPPDAEVTVAELNPKIVEWCHGPLAQLTGHAAGDPRVTLAISDVAELVRTSAPEHFDAVIYDLYRGPHPKTDRLLDPLYGSRAIAQVHAALKPQGVFAIWGENPDAAFQKRLEDGGFSVRCERPGKGGYRHAVWVALRTEPPRKNSHKKPSQGITRRRRAPHR